MFIRTERLLLRPSWPEDLDELMSGFIMMAWQVIDGPLGDRTGSPTPTLVAAAERATVAAR